MMSQLEKWKRKVKDKTETDPEAIKQYMLSNAVEGDPFRLEFLQDADNGLLLIQGNLAGFTYLIDTLNRLVTTATIGGHTHLEEGHPLNKADVSVVIQLVDDDEENDGPHRVS